MSIETMMDYCDAMYDIEVQTASRLTDHFQLHFLRLGDMRNNSAGLDKLNTDLRNWMTFLAYGFEYERDKMNAMLMESPLVKEAYEEYKKFSLSRSTVRRYAAACFALPETA